MFEYKSKIYKSELKTQYGSICIKNIIFEPKQIEEALLSILFKDENLMYMFAENELNSTRKRNIIDRFIPKEEITGDISDYITLQMKNVNFYSFLAEGILSLVYRDIYNYELSCGVIDVNDTLNDTHTGVDSCMYNLEKKTIVLGEAKFYENSVQGMNSIIADFKGKNIKNKLSSLLIKSMNNEESYSILIKNIKKGYLEEIHLNDFLENTLTFAGFVLHSEKNSVPVYNDKFYDRFKISVEDLSNNIEKELNFSLTNKDYDIILIHLPINDKKDLIKKVISTAKEERIGVIKC